MKTNFKMKVLAKKPIKKPSARIHINVDCTRDEWQSVKKASKDLKMTMGQLLIYSSQVINENS